MQTCSELNVCVQCELNPLSCPVAVLPPPAPPAHHSVGPTSTSPTTHRPISPPAHQPNGPPAQWPTTPVGFREVPRSEAALHVTDTTQVQREIQGISHSRRWYLLRVPALPYYTRAGPPTQTEKKSCNKIRATNNFFCRAIRESEPSFRVALP